MKSIIYHDRCPDGFAAAMAAHMVFGNADAVYLPASHGSQPPNISGGEVYIVDFSYPLEIMQTLARQAQRLVWLDHHASVLPVRDAFVAWLEASGQSHKTHINIDMDRSGAVLAWNYFHPDRPTPRLFLHVQDRDLWNWEIPDTDSFTSALDDLPVDFTTWENLLTSLEDENTYTEFVRIGEIGNRKYLKLCEQIAEGAETIGINGIPGLQVNASGNFASHVGDLLATRSGTYGLIWNIRDGQVRLSFRGAPNFDVLPLAGKFGGGGHKSAAGARIPLNQLGELLGEKFDHPIPSIAS
jgi:uncharacterized protein